MDKEKNKKRFLYKKSYLERRLQKDVMENGIAYIPCKVEGIDDIISKLSVKGCESLDPEFMGYIMGFIEFIPTEYPVVLEIHGPRFCEEEKITIRETIASEMDYSLGKVEEENHFLRKRFIRFIIGTLISGVLLTIARRFIADVPLEIFYIIFWLFADAAVRYLFIEKYDFKEQKIRMGRMASMTVEFAEENP